MSNKEIDSAYALLQGRQTSDPKLTEALNIIVKNLGSLFDENERLRSQISAIVAKVLAPTDLAAELKFRSIELTWIAISGALFYEIRIGSFDDWTNASYVTRVTNTTVALDPKLAGTYTYLIKAYNTASIASNEWDYVTVIVPDISLGGVTASVIDNNVLLDWVEPTHPFEIIEYRVYREGVQVGYVDSSFFVYFESAGGEFDYSIKAVDIAGNESNLSTITALVNQPPDFVLETTYVSILDGTKINCKTDTNSGGLVAIIDLTETWGNHFTGQGWDQIQDQIAAGFPYYHQPDLSSGSYEEIHDFGVLYETTIITISWSTFLVSDTVLAAPSLSVSSDGISYTAYEPGFSLYAAEFRYVKFKIDFTGVADENDLCVISDITLNVSVKQVMDSGSIEALLTDVLGTEVFFNKDYKDVDSITATVQSTNEPYNVVVDFQDIPDPVSFKVFVYDTSGQRVTKFIDWKARGVEG